MSDSPTGDQGIADGWAQSADEVPGNGKQGDTAGGYVGFHGPIQTEGAATFGPNSQAVNAENFYQGAEFLDRFAEGERRFREGMYPAAIDNFTRYLDGATGNLVPATDPSMRSRAYLYIAIALLAKVPAAYHSQGRIDKVIGNLIAADGLSRTDHHDGSTPLRDPLVSLLAALILEDYYLQDWMSAPARLVELARDSVQELSTEDVELVAAHVAPCSGRGWSTFTARAAALGIAVGIYQADEPPPPMDALRRIGVPKYFTPTPLPPRPVSNVGAIVMGSVSGFLLLVMVVLLASMELEIAIFPSFLSLVGAVGLFVGAIVAYLRYRGYGPAYQAYLHACRLAEPKPSDEQMDEWLRQDTERIVRVGIHRHRLNTREGDLGGDLLTQPMIIVGVSRRQRLVPRWRLVANASVPVVGVAPARDLVPVDLAQVRRGRDGYLRADYYHVLAIYLTPQRICTFEVELELATRRFHSERTRSFHYNDVVAVATELKPASPAVRDFILSELRESWGTPATTGLPSAPTPQVEIIEDEQFTLSIVNGEKITVSIGLSAHGTGQFTSLIKWGNHHVRKVVERMVWSRKDAAALR